LPDLALRDFWLFPKLKRPLRETRFGSIEKIKAEPKKALMALQGRTGKNVGIGVFYREGITLMVMK